jgi:hypothetical protein
MTLRRRFVGSLIGLGVALIVAAPALADQSYTIDGTDSFTAGTQDLRSNVVYNGRETLSMLRRGDRTRFAVAVDYQRSGQGGPTRAHASFVSVVGPGGEQHDEVNADPDYVTVLNQPFTIILDAVTMSDLQHLKAPVPFSFILPITGSPLHGSLRNGGTALVGGVRSLGIVFDAEGPVHGPLGRVGLSLRGRIHMHGTAYYSYGAALLRALETRLVISGRLIGSSDDRLVTIVYRRTIHAVAQTPLKEASQ